jgi:uncharacterized PurR-regulated membrane protein YhhQ (DUF165 family)
MVIWTFIYIAAVLSANYTATWFIPLPGFGLVALGTLLFGVTFTARDYAHHLGRPKVYVMIITAALASAALVGLGATPWRVVMASVIAIVLSETADTEVYQQLIAKPWLVRVTGSNLVSIPLDTALFNLLAFGGVFPWAVLVAIIGGEIIVKFLVGGLVALWKLTSKNYYAATEKAK